MFDDIPGPYQSGQELEPLDLPHAARYPQPMLLQAANGLIEPLPK